MAFQLVRASDDDIAVWQTDHGHIYVFQVTPDRSGLMPVTMRDAPDATAPAHVFADEALAFATAEAGARLLIRERTAGDRGRRRPAAHV